jgi:hypothetical protein
MKKVHFEISWHIKGDQAKVINLKGFLTSFEITENYGKDVHDEFFFKGSSCSKISVLVSPKNTVPRIEFVKFITDPLTKEDVETFGELTLWKTVPLDEIEHYTNIMKEAENHLNELIEQKQKKQELERS